MIEIATSSAVVARAIVVAVVKAGTTAAAKYVVVRGGSDDSSDKSWAHRVVIMEILVVKWNSMAMSHMWVKMKIQERH